MPPSHPYPTHPDHQLLWSNEVQVGDIIVCGDHRFPVLRIEQGWTTEKFIIDVQGVETPHDTSLQAFGRFEVCRNITCKACQRGVPCYP